MNIGNSFEGESSVTIKIITNDHDTIKALAKENNVPIQVVMRAALQLFLGKYWDLNQRELKKMFCDTNYSVGFQKTVRHLCKKEIEKYVREHKNL